jgi:hypothetical protein
MTLYFKKKKLPKLPSFIEYIKIGNLEKAKEYLQSNPNYNMDAQHAFGISCMYGYLEIAQWLQLNYKQNFDIHAFDDLAFRQSCFGGHIKVAKWLFENFDCKINIENIRGYFCTHCYFHYYDMAKWFLTLYFDNVIEFIEKTNYQIDDEIKNIIEEIQKERKKQKYMFIDTNDIIYI